MEYVKITEYRRKKYMKAPDQCPFCNSEDITGGHLDADSDMAYRDVQCNNPKCGMTWTEHFKMIGIDEAFKSC
jgi:transcription elongation factor Elf1